MTQGKRCLFLAVAVLLLAATAAQAQDFDVRLDADLVIGDDESAEREYLLNGPRTIRTDSDGRIYIADDRRQYILVYSEDGEYVTGLGRRGQGPGEFSDMLGMTVGFEDEVVVGDRINKRITIFRDLGETVETYPLPEERFVPTRWIAPLAKGGYLIHYQVGDHTEPRDTWMNFHKYTPEIEKAFSFGTTQQFYDTNEPLLREWFVVRYLAMDPRGRLLLAPQFYDGEIHRWERQDDGSWEHISPIQGKPFDGRAYQMKDISRFDSVDAFFDKVERAGGLSGGYYFQWLRSSRGLAVFPDGRMAHFSVLHDDGVWRFGVELFDAEGKYLGYSPIEEYYDVYGERIEWVLDRGARLLHVDNEGRLYFTRALDGFPVMDRVTMHVEGIDW